jgi:hypothetical protein
VEVPEDVRIGLANIDPTLHARWNPLARVVGGHSFDVNGNPRHLTHDSRWELWAKDVFGKEYRITVLEDEQGGFVPLGHWVVDMMNFMNPANYDGDLSRMVEKLVDAPNRDVERVGKRQFEELIDFLADLCWTEETKGSRITVPQHVM